jgi:hypothetical protein
MLAREGLPFDADESPKTISMRSWKILCSAGPALSMPSWSCGRLTTSFRNKGDSLPGNEAANLDDRLSDNGTGTGGHAAGLAIGKRNKNPLPRRSCSTPKEHGARKGCCGKMLLAPRLCRFFEILTRERRIEQAAKAAGSA